MMVEIDIEQVCDLESVVAAPPVVIKIGGSTLDDAQPALAEIASLWRAGWQPVVVHGGGPAINAMLERLGVEPRFIGGRRVTDPATLDVVRAVLVGQINSELVRRLEVLHCAAVGLSGLDGQLVRARRAAPELGLVGLVAAVYPALLRSLTRAGFVPVIAPLGLGPADEALNINADDVATAVATALHASALIFLSNVPGVNDAQGDAIPLLASAHARDLIARGVISGGMVPKIEGCLAALEQVRSVHIINGAIPHGICRALLGHDHPGTCIVA